MKTIKQIKSCFSDMEKDENLPLLEYYYNNNQDRKMQRNKDIIEINKYIIGIYLQTF